MQAYTFRLRPTTGQAETMRRFAGCCRFVWNKALEYEQKAYAETGKRLGYYKLTGLLVEWKKAGQTSFLADAHAQILQQSLKDLDRAYTNFFEGRARLPKFKKKGQRDAFRYPQHFKLDEGNARVFLPKIGWVRYRKSRTTEGTPKQVTVSCSCGHWHVSIQTRRDCLVPAHPSQSKIGLDLGVASFAVDSSGIALHAPQPLKRYGKKLAKLQRQRARKQKFSSNYYKLSFKIQRLQKRISDTRHDFLHKASTTLSKNHALIVVEDLRIRNMTKSASGTLEKPGRNVRGKSGLNRAILDQGWGAFLGLLEYKLAWRGGELRRVPPHHTSQACSLCGYTDPKNRVSRALFARKSCGYANDADLNAALNILAAGLAATACGADRAQAAAVKQEPTRVAA